jgi:uncharacterized membrane protein
MMGSILNRWVNELVGGLIVIVSFGIYLGRLELRERRRKRVRRLIKKLKQRQKRNNI